MTIDRNTSLREIAFLVCTELERAGVRAVLTGGSAATVHSAGDYQSRDLDFIITFRADDATPSEALSSLGFTLEGPLYSHKESPFSLEFPTGPLSAGKELIRTWDTLKDEDRILHILTPTDCCRDRLAGFLFWNDRGSLEQAVAVARRQAERVDLEAIQSWCEREGVAEKYQEFLRALDRGNS